MLNALEILAIFILITPTEAENPVHTKESRYAMKEVCTYGVHNMYVCNNVGEGYGCYFLFLAMNDACLDCQP